MEHVIATAQSTEQTNDELISYFAETWGARDMSMSTVDILVNLAWWTIGCEKITNLTLLLEYADRWPKTGRKRVPVDVDHLVGRWVDVIVGLSTAHDHAARTAADHEMDELLGPIMIAPVSQIREFAQKLGKALREDKRVPFLIWSMFERTLEQVILKGKDSEILKLRIDLATEVAELTEKGMDREDLIVALAGALQWRDPERLAKIKTRLQQGERPRITGRQSCLFLSVGDGAEKETVVL